MHSDRLQRLVETADALLEPKIEGETLKQHVTQLVALYLALTELHDEACGAEFAERWVGATNSERFDMLTKTPRAWQATFVAGFRERIQHKLSLSNTETEEWVLGLRLVQRQVRKGS